MDLDANIMQTKTVGNIVDVLINIEKELVMPKNRELVAEIINRHEIAMSLVKSYQE